MGPLGEEVGTSGEAFRIVLIVAFVVYGKVFENAVENVEASDGFEGGGEFAGHEVDPGFNIGKSPVQVAIFFPEQDPAGGEACDEKEGDCAKGWIVADPANEFFGGERVAGNDGFSVEPLLQVLGEGRCGGITLPWCTRERL